MQGFSGEQSKIKDLPFGVGITVIDLTDGKVMVRVNEGIVTPFQSILSCNQMRSFGTVVDDCPRMHGGMQKITLPNGPTLPLQYIGGLTYLPMRKPSKEELASLPIIDITCSAPWNPKMNETDLVQPPDRKSTRLNSSHGYISYAVFCLKKKKKNKNNANYTTI